MIHFIGKVFLKGLIILNLIRVFSQKIEFDKYKLAKEIFDYQYLKRKL